MGSSLLSRLNRITARFVGNAGHTRPDTLGEAGQLRLRLLRGRSCEAVIVNTAGGVVGGDRMALDIGVRGAGAFATISTVAAEKFYRSEHTEIVIDTILHVDEGASLHWLPQEAILFDGTRVRRSLTVDLGASDRFLGVESTVFGRLARGETMDSGSFRDAWRVRRAGRLVFADETRIVEPICATLDRSGVGRGARAVALIILAETEAERFLAPLREALASFHLGDPARIVEWGASARDGVLTVRCVSRCPESLRCCIAAAVTVMRVLPLPRGWI